MLKSTDFSDVGTHTYTYTCFYTDFPDEKVEATITLTVYDCDASSAATHSNDKSCACAKLDGFDGWTTADWELVDPTVAVEVFPKIAEYKWFDKNGLDTCVSTGIATGIYMVDD